MISDVEAHVEQRCVTEQTLRIIQLQPPCRRQGHQPSHLILDQAAQGPIQPGLEHHQGQSIHSIFGQLFQHLTALIIKGKLRVVLPADLCALC